MKNWVLMGLALLAVVGCRPAAEKEARARPLVVTTVTMVTDLVKEIGGERVDVEGLMGAGVDPHSYIPSLPDSAKLESADAVFYCGLHLEGKMQVSLERMAEGSPHVHAVTDGVSEDRLLAPEEEFEGHHDPHIWGDPSVWVETIPVVVEGLTAIDPEGEAYYEERGKVYAERLKELHEWARNRVAEVPKEKRVLVTSHDAFFYFGRAYEFEVRGLQGLSTVSEIGLRDRKDLVAFIKERGIRTIFPESSVNPKAIEAVAKQAGVTASKEELFSDAMGEVGEVATRHGETYDKGTYIGMVKHNVNSIVDGLK